MRAKDGCATVRLSDTVAVAAPLEPVIVATYSPMTAALDVVKVSVVPVVEETGEKDAVTPLGKPETTK